MSYQIFASVKRYNLKHATQWIRHFPCTMRPVAATLLPTPARLYRRLKPVPRPEDILHMTPDFTVSNFITTL